MRKILVAGVIVAASVGACSDEPVAAPSSTIAAEITTTVAPTTTIATTVTAPEPVGSTTTTTPQAPRVELELQAGAIVTSYHQTFRGTTDPGTRVLVNGLDAVVDDSGGFELGTWWNTLGPNVVQVRAIAPDGRSRTVRVPYEFVPETPRWVAFVGDSIMRGATPEIEEIFGEDVVSALSGRRFDEGIPIIERILRESSPQLLIVGLGSNGPVRPEDFDTVMELAAGIARVAYVNVRVDRRWEEDSNRELAAGVARYDNTLLIDWHTASEDEETLLKADGVHPTAAGRAALARLVADAVFPHWSATAAD